MRDFIKIILSILIAILLYTTLGKIFPPLIYLFNFFSLVIIYFAIKKEEVFGACLGAACGLIQDSLSLGVFGVYGLAKTVTGYLAGYLSKKIDLLSAFRSFVFILVLVSIEFILWMLLYSFVFSEKISIGKCILLFQPLATALLGSFIFSILGLTKKPTIG
jgi:rod shape-determining protein MreD